MLDYIEIGKKEGRLIAGGNAPATPDGGYFLEPTVFADVAPNAVLAQEEIFGPVLAVIKVASFEEGLPSPTTPSTASPAPSTPPIASASTAPAANSTSAISTSTASAPAPWSARIPSAAST